MANLGMTADQNASIKSRYDELVNANGNDFGSVMSEMNKYGVSTADLSKATGVSQDQLGHAFMANGAGYGFGGYTGEYGVSAPQESSASGQQNMASQPGGSSLGFSSQTSAPAMQGYTQNPYLSQVTQGMQTQSNDNWTRNLQPSIRSGAMAAGGFGGSRQGVVEANALKDQNNNLTNATASLYANDYNTQMGRNLSQYQSDQGYNLGLRSSDLGFSNLDASINQNNTQNQLNYANFGLNTYNTQQAGNNSAANAATTLQNTPYNNWQNFNQQANSSGGAGGTSTSSATAPGNAALGALAGWQIGSQYGKTTS